MIFFNKGNKKTHQNPLVKFLIEAAHPPVEQKLQNQTFLSYSYVNLNNLLIDTFI